MADANSVSPGLATLGAGGWTVTEPSAGGRFGSVGVLTPQQTLATQALVSVARNPVNFLSNGQSLSTAFVGGPSPWVRLAGPNQFSAAPWAYSTELTTPNAAAAYVSAANTTAGPSMFRSEGAAILVDGKV